MKRAHRVLAWLAAPLLSMCGAGAEINGMKLAPTGIRIEQINIGGGAQGPDPSAGQKGATEYDSAPQVCRFIEKDGKRVAVECDR